MPVRCKYSLRCELIRKRTLARARRKEDGNKFNGPNPKLTSFQDLYDRYRFSVSLLSTRGCSLRT